MALLNFTGFETGDGAECAALSGAASVQSSIARTGTYAMRVNRASGVTKGYAQIGQYGSDGKPTTLPTSWAASFYFYVNALPSNNAQVLFSADSIPQFSGTAFAHIGTSGAITGFVNGTGSSYTVSIQTWYRMDIVVVQSGATTIQLYDVAGSLLATIGNGTADATNPQYLFLGEVGGIAASSYDVVFDDVAIDDSAAPGKCEVKVAVPTGNSATNTAWSASAGNKWACVDELPPSATDYIESLTTAGDRRYSATHASCATLGVAGAILGTKVVSVMWEPTSTTTLGAVGIRSGSTNFELSNVDIGTTAEVTMCRVDGTDPNTSAAWTTSGVDAAEPLVKRSTSDTSNIRCKWLGLMILSAGAVSTTIMGATAAATAAAGAGTIATQQQPTISGITASATAAANAGVVAAQVQTAISGVVATATADALAGTVSAGSGSASVTVIGETAAATAAANAATIASVRIVAVAGEKAAATAAANAGTVAAQVRVTVSGAKAAASATANAGTIASVRIVAVAGEKAAATAAANAGTVAAQVRATVSGAVAAATAAANAGTVASVRIVSVSGALAAANAAALAGSIATGAIATIAGETAVCTAQAYSGAVAAQATVTVAGETAEAAAAALAAVLVVITATVGARFAPPIATVRGTPSAPAPRASGRQLPAPRARVVP